MATVDKDPAISSRSPRVLFITRRYPPSIGGIQHYCFQLYTHLSALTPVKRVSLGLDSLLHLGWFMPWAFLVALCALIFRRADALFFADGVVASMAFLLRPLSRIPFVVTVYGLEMTYGNPLFGRLMRWGVRCCDRVVVISKNSRELMRQEGLPEARLALIYVGVKPLLLSEERCRVLRERFERRHGLRFGRERILVTIGRLVRRKGIVPFVEKGMPLLDSDIRFIVAGGGAELERLRRLREKLDLGGRLLLLGPPSDEVVAMLRQSADLFLLPNIHLPGDVEGFGMAQLEAMYAGTPVVAFAVDALSESVRLGGYLIPPEDYRAYVEQIHRFYRLSAAEREAKRREARAYVRREYRWERAARQYLDLFTGEA